MCVCVAVVAVVYIRVAICGGTCTHNVCEVVVNGCGGGGGGGVSVCVRVCMCACVCVYVLVHLCVRMGQRNN